MLFSIVKLPDVDGLRYLHNSWVYEFNMRGEVSRKGVRKRAYGLLASRSVCECLEVGVKDFVGLVYGQCDREMIAGGRDHLGLEASLAQERVHCVRRVLRGRDEGLNLFMHCISHEGSVGSKRTYLFLAEELAVLSTRRCADGVETFLETSHVTLLERETKGEGLIRRRSADLRETAWDGVARFMNDHVALRGRREGESGENECNGERVHDWTGGPQGVVRGLA